MTPATLARITASIDADAATLDANWPLARDRERAYLALGRAVAEHRAWVTSPEANALPWDGRLIGILKHDTAIGDALAALGTGTSAPDAAAVAGEAGT